LNILKIVTIYCNKGVIYLAGIVILEPILYSIGYAYLKSHFYKDLRALRYKKETILLILSDSFPLIFASAFFLIYSRIDQVMLKNMIGAEAVGLYDSAVRISELSYFIPQLILVSLLPAVVNAKNISLLIYYARVKKLLVLILVISIAIALGTTIISKYLLLTIFGEKFLGALPALYICAWSTIGASLNSFAQQIFVIENSTKNISISAFLGMITNITLNLILIPIYGISGAATATLISYAIPFLSLFLFKKTRSVLMEVIRS
jgi:O-antigen/teichoic acid export membrane protein